MDTSETTVAANTVNASICRPKDDTINAHKAIRYKNGIRVNDLISRSSLKKLL